MGRRATFVWHAALSIAAGVLYFFFALPRWPELMGDTSHGLGTVARIAAGILIALAALPVVFTLLESRKPEFGTPALALTLRTWSVVSHVAAGVLIVGAAVAEIWLSLDSCSASTVPRRRSQRSASPGSTCLLLPRRHRHRPNR
jgi:predicted CDP-diglyceride synthetase/phosphatidate cytidylyltransferase